MFAKRKDPAVKRGLNEEEMRVWSEDELGDIVVEPLPADRIIRCGGEPFRTEDGPDDRRGGKKVVHALERDPTADREHDEEQDARFQEP